MLNSIRDAVTVPTFRIWWQVLQAWLDRKPDEMLRNLAMVETVKIQFDPEAMFLEGWMLCEAGALEDGLTYVRRGVSRGYCAVSTLARSRHFDPLRNTQAFQAVQAEAEAGRDRALAAFREAGGERLLGRPA